MDYGHGVAGDLRPDRPVGAFFEYILRKGGSEGRAGHFRHAGDAEGAAKALRERGRSLLPAGVLDAEGDFGIGDLIACEDAARHEIARGLAAYTAADVRRIKGLGTAEISRVLGYSNGDEVIHRDDLVLLEELPEEGEER